ncbi:MAG: MFS transporter [Chloroflexi bacterium]|nr:MFS transporter [Chloroflexota bacterium]
MQTSPDNEHPRLSLRNLPRNVWAVTLTSLLTDISSEMIVHLFPLYLANVLGARANIIGLIDGLAEMTASLLKLASGWLSDKLQSRKWLTVAGYSLSTIAKPFLLIANSWGAVLAIRLADRAGKGIRTAPRDALVADSVHESQRGAAFGIHRAGDTLGAALGLLVALVIVALTQRAGVALSQGTFRLLVGISIIPAILAVAVLLVVAQETPKKIDGKLPTLSLVGFDRRFKFFLVIIVLFTLGNSSDAFLVLRAQSVGANVATIMAMILVFNITYAVVSGPAGRLSDRIGRRRVMITGWIIYGLVYLGFAFAGTVWQLFALYAVYGLYYGMAEGVGKAFVADLVPKEKRGTAYGLYNAAVGLTALPASFIAGILWQGMGAFAGFGPSAPFVFGSALTIVAAVLLALL